MDGKNSITVSKSKTNVTSTTQSLGLDPNKARQPWLNAWRDPLAGVKAFSQCVRLSDLYGDGDFRLVVGDNEKSLIIYQGANIDKRYPVLDSPTAVTLFYAEQAKIRE